MLLKMTFNMSSYIPAWCSCTTFLRCSNFFFCICSQENSFIKITFCENIFFIFFIQGFAEKTSNMKVGLLFLINICSIIFFLIFLLIKKKEYIDVIAGEMKHPQLYYIKTFKIPIFFHDAGNTLIKWGSFEVFYF